MKIRKKLPCCKEHKTIGENIRCETEYINNLLKKDFFYENISLEKLAKKFLNDFLDIDIFQSDFTIIKEKYMEIFKDSDYPKDSEREFYSYILDEYLEIKSTPYQNLINILLRSQKKLNEVSIEIESLGKKLKAYEQKKLLRVEDRYNKKHIEYYLSKNKNIKEKIINFITNDIKFRAYQESKKNHQLMMVSYLPIGVNIGFSYRFMNTAYIENFDVLTFQFGFLPNKGNDLLKDLYLRKDKKEFYEVLEYLFNEYLIFKTLNTGLDENHILNTRKRIFKSIFQHFENKDYISINNMIPLQIEGLFYDFCLLLGISEKSLEISSLNSKLDKIKEKNNKSIWWHYEYFSFKFPIIRNKVAHGRYLESDDKLTSYLLFIDLYNVCEMITDRDIELNQYVKYLKDEKISDKKILELVKFKGIELPKFYNLDKVCLEITERIKSKEFISFLNTELDDISLDKLDVFREQVLYLKKNFKAEKLKSIFSVLEDKRKELKKEEERWKKEFQNLLKDCYIDK